MRYLCSTLGMGLVLGGQGSVVLTGHSDASWADDQATQRSSQGYTFSLGSGSVSWRSTRSSSVLSSNCALLSGVIRYAGAMTAQELRWLTYLLTDLGERPRSPPVLYYDTHRQPSLPVIHINLLFLLAVRGQQRQHHSPHHSLPCPRPIPLRHLPPRHHHQPPLPAPLRIPHHIVVPALHRTALPPRALHHHQHRAIPLPCLQGRQQGGRGQQQRQQRGHAPQGGPRGQRHPRQPGRGGEEAEGALRGWQRGQVLQVRSTGHHGHGRRLGLSAAQPCHWQGGGSGGGGGTGASGVGGGVGRRRGIGVAAAVQCGGDEGPGGVGRSHLLRPDQRCLSLGAAPRLPALAVRGERQTVSRLRTVPRDGGERGRRMVGKG
ncbi:unnamed protein product [Closterium sp. NIES-54]